MIVVTVNNMIGLFHYSKTEQESLLKSMTILVDTREQKNDHILQYFNERKIPWKKCKLDFGDYAPMLPKNSELNIDRDLYFDKEIMVERKNNLEEISNNLTSDRQRIKTEFANAPKHKILIIENASYQDMINGNYNTQYNPKSFWASIFSLWHQYDLPCIYLENEKYTAHFIYGYFYYYLRNKIKG